MKVTKITLFTRLYEFNLNEYELYTKAKRKLELKGKIEECFINNKYAFEFTQKCI